MIEEEEKACASQWDCRWRLRISSAHYQKTQQFLKAAEFQKECYYFDRKIQQRI